MPIDLVAATVIVADMSSTLISNGYVPVITIGCAEVGDGNIVFALAGGPGISQEMVDEILEDLARARREGKVNVVWTHPQDEPSE